MKNRLVAALAVACVALSLSGCQTLEYYQGKIAAAITKTDAVIAKNKEAMQNVCVAGEYAHEQFLVLVDSGALKISDKDLAQEASLHQAGLDLCADIPNDLASLLQKMPLIQNYIAQIAAFKNKVN